MTKYKSSEAIWAVIVIVGASIAAIVIIFVSVALGFMR